jgi:molybdenum cofactor cytidylyltransferase
MIPAIVLAAGASSRMGRSKALLKVGSESFLNRITRTLYEAGVDEVIVVVRGAADEASATLEDVPRRARLIVNPRPDDGQLSSLLVGLRAADRPGVRAVLVTLVDLPLISVDTVRAVLDAYRRSQGARIVRPTLNGRYGHPVIFDRTLFEELRRADPAAGAKSVVRAHQADTINVEAADEGAFLDIDTPEDYAMRITGPAGRASGS